jgi:ABC-2 type transport system ATP-binding protein
VEVTTERPLPLENLPEKIRNEKHTSRFAGRTLSVQSPTPAALIVELVRWIDQLGFELQDIHMKRPTLEDVFIELTGKRLRES